MALEDVLDLIRKAEVKAGRAEGTVDLVAVSKQQPLDRLEAVLAAGHRVFGENRVQEAQGKWPKLRLRYPDVTLHVIGPLQTNKVRAACELFDVIESVDREKLAAKIAEVGAELGRTPRLYVQVNTGEEPQKAGVAPAETVSFVRRCEHVHGLKIEGLMAIPPAEQPPAPHFALLAKLAEECGLEKLSMGMSADFETAIDFGATSVRVGSRLFGARPKRADGPVEA